MGKAKQLQGLMASFGIDARIVLRKRYFVVYVKEGSQIVDLLNIMEAPVALMELENIRIVKEMRNTVNRKVNCETANINKTVSAAVKQMEDIRYICDTVGLESLPVQVASQYDSKIYLEADSKRVNAKSIMGMMTLGLVTGESITVEADGTDEEQAVAEIEKYLQNQ